MVGGLRHDALIELLAKLGATDIDTSSDYTHSVGRDVIRCVFQRERSVAVGAQARTGDQIRALIDVLYLRAFDTKLSSPRVEQSGVSVIISDDGTPRHREVLDALDILRSAYRGDARIRVFSARSDGEMVERQHQVIDFSKSGPAARWAPLLELYSSGPPALARELVARVVHPAVRLYPMLTTVGTWSVRVEGLEVARVEQGGMRVDVGKPGRYGALSEARQQWQAVTGSAAPLIGGAADVERIAEVIRRFADARLSAETGGLSAGSSRQDEHALESRILRGAVPVELSDGTRLELLRPDSLVNWGSQFPTLWSTHPHAESHHLDGLLRAGSTPWAVEMKVEGAGGRGRYYRGGLAQVVLYRAFIRSAVPLHRWFHHQTPPVEPTNCGGALVVPRFEQAGARFESSLRSLCRSFDVELSLVAPDAARLAWEGD